MVCSKFHTAQVFERILSIYLSSGNSSRSWSNYDASKAVSATISVLKWSGAIFRPTSSTPSVRSFCLCTYHWKLSSSWVSTESSGLENIPRITANRAKDAQNQDGSKLVSPTLSLWKWSGAIFRVYKLDTERALLLPVSFSLRTKSIER